ncbi:unnamed protein product [Closterium sp. Naga37s-1]|nr:unnamed protein product [Closterium sp. Naga37s-1]
MSDDFHVVTDCEEQNVSAGLGASSNILGESNKGNIAPNSSAGGAGDDAAGKPARSARFSEKVVEARTRELIDVLDSLRTAGEANLESLALSNECIREDGVDCGDDRQWRLKEEGKEHRVLYRKGPEGTPLHEICLEGIIHGPLDTLLAVVWEVPFFKDWWPQFSVPPFKVLESKFAHRITPGLELSYLQFKSPWPFATRELLFFAFMVQDTATGLFVASVLSPPDDISHMDPETAALHPSAIPSIAPGCVRMSVGGGFAGQALGRGRSYLRSMPSPRVCVLCQGQIRNVMREGMTWGAAAATSGELLSGACTLDMKFDLMPPWLINFVARQLAGSGYHQRPLHAFLSLPHSLPVSAPSSPLLSSPNSGACTLDMKFDLMPPWLINFVARQLAGAGYHLLCHEVDTIVKATAAAAASEKCDKKCDKKNGRGAFQQLLASDPVYVGLRKAMEEYRRGKAEEEERRRREGSEEEGRSLRELGEKVEEEVERLVSSLSKRESVLGPEEAEKALLQLEAAAASAVALTRPSVEPLGSQAKDRSGSRAASKYPNRHWQHQQRQLRCH